MQTLAQYKPNNSRAILLVGQPGSGKTTLAIQAPRPWLFDADNNVNGPAARLAEDSPTKLATVKYTNGVVDEAGKEIPPMQRWEKMLLGIKTAAADPEVGVLVFDGMTAIAQFAQDAIRKAANIPEGEPLRIQDWGTFANFMRKLVVTVRAVGKPSIFTAHQVSDKDEATGIYKTFLAIQGQSRSTFAGLFSDCWNTFIKESGVGEAKTYTRMLRTVPTNAHDERGLKESLKLAPTMTQAEAIKIFSNLL